MLAAGRQPYVEIYLPPTFFFLFVFSFSLNSGLLLESVGKAYPTNMVTHMLQLLR